MGFTNWLRNRIHPARWTRRPPARGRYRPRLQALEDRTLPSTFLVSNVADSGPGSLRQAILDANAHAGADVIDFAIGSGTQSIAVGSTTSSPLPTITDSVTLDGTSQPGYSGTPLIELDGTSAGTNATGLVLAASNCTVQGLVINRFSRHGIDLLKSSNVIQGNYVGVDATGNTLRAEPAGIEVLAAGNTIGGTAAGAGNVIGDGIGLGFADGTLIQGNTIGLGADGTTVLGNQGYGVYVTHSLNVVIGGDTPAARNVISGNSGFGIITDVVANGLVIEGNYIGTDRTGALARPNTYYGISISSPDVFIGGLTATPGTGPGNVISGNGSGPASGGGIAIAGSGGDVVEGNIIGLDASGSTALNNFQDGGVVVEAPNVTIGGTAAGAGNVISGNGSGVSLATPAATGDVVEGNDIGTDVSGTQAAANLYGVVSYDGASGNTIGDATAGAGNVIAFNRLVGVVVLDASSTGNSIRGNSIHDNGGLGIDLGLNGVTLNDSAGHVGPNNYQNFPVLTSATLSGGMTQVSGQLDSTPNTTFTLDFYANTLPDPSGYGEGQTYLSSWSVTTDGSGHACFTATVAAAPGSQHFLTATATDPGHNTSEFSPDTIISPSSLSGMVFEDFNNDGQVDFGEQGIAGVTVALTGTDDLGRPVNLSQTTGTDGAYYFGNLLPGSYTLTETQPAGYTQGVDSVGTAGGSLAATDQFFVQLGQGVDGINYNYGERPPAGPAIQQGQTAGIGFWHNKNGQALILALNGGGSSTQLADWLAATLPNLYGASAGSHDLTGKSNADVAALFQSDFAQTGPKLDAQVLATALAVYVTNATLDPTQNSFTVSGDGVGTATVNVGSNGDAFGVANNTTMTVMDLLLATNDQAVDGVLYNGNKTLRSEANNVYSAVNNAGGI